MLATRLVLLRSRLLFPVSPEAAVEAEQEAGAELRRLEEMVFVRAAASWLTARPQLGIDVFVRLPATASSREGGYVALMEACLVVLKGGGARPEEALVYRRSFQTFGGFLTHWFGSGQCWRSIRRAAI